MRIRVLYFAGLRERAGCDQDDLDLPPGALLADAVAEAGRRRTALSPLDASVRFALNRELADGSASLAAGDEVALLPPVSGG